MGRELDRLLPRSAERMMMKENEMMMDKGKNMKEGMMK